jgi:hypothetical protein
VHHPLPSLFTKIKEEPVSHASVESDSSSDLPLMLLKRFDCIVRALTPIPIVKALLMQRILTTTIVHILTK